MVNFTSPPTGRSTPDKELRYSLNGRLGGPHSRSGRFGEENNFLFSAGIRTPDGRTRSLVTITTTLSRFLYFKYVTGVSQKVVGLTLVWSVLPGINRSPQQAQNELINFTSTNGSCKQLHDNYV